MVWWADPANLLVYFAMALPGRTITSALNVSNLVDFMSMRLCRTT